MPNADGSIIIKADVDDKNAEKRLSQLNRTIASTEKQLSRLEQKKLPLVDEAIRLGIELDKAVMRLNYMQSGVEFFPEASVRKQAELVSGLQKEFDAVDKKAVEAANKVKTIEKELQDAKEEAGALTQRMTTFGYQAGKAVNEAGKRVDRFRMRLREVLRSALVFTLITQSLAKFREWMGNVIKTNEEATNAFARLKGALLTLAQPLIDVIIPAFVTFLNILADMVSAVATLVSSLFGTTVEASSEAAESLYEETEALNATGAAAKKAGKSLASFDEINQLAGDSSASSGANAMKIEPIFEINDNGFLDWFQKVLPIIEAIGAALLYWKLPAALRNGLPTLAGLFLSLDGAVRLVKNTFDAWTNGVDWQNLLGMLLATAELALGLYLIFGKTGLAIGLLVGGIAMLVTAFHDAFENGWNLQNLLMAVAGILASGIGIGVLVGSWIPVLVAAIAAVLLAITVLTGNGEALLEGLKTVFRGLVDFIAGVFTGDLDRALQGISTLFEGLGQIVTAVFDSLASILPARLQNIVLTIKDLLLAAISFVKEFLTGLIQFVVGVFTGNWELAWKGIGNMAISALNALIGAFESVLSFIIRAINNFIKSINTTISGIGNLVGADWKGITWKATAPKFNRIPMLAQGAVIPPNREFMAILGDQTSGNNIEAPEGLIRKIVREEAGMNAELLQAILEAVREGKDIYLDGEKVSRNQVRHINNMTQRAGKSVLIY